jgi:3-hydroxyacyl-CoA dehydrogenase
MCKQLTGFIVNRLLIPYLAQAMGLVDRKVASVPDIDSSMQLGAGHPMGPLTLADYVGLDTCLSILQGWRKEFPNEPAFFIPVLNYAVNNCDM